MDNDKFLKETTMKKDGIILWQGKSLIDNQRIVCIATGLSIKSANTKTGSMIQTWIIRRDIDPMLARRLGEDKSVCGNCKHREQSTCYVNLCHGPINIFKAFHDGKYSHFQTEDIELFKNRSLRIGSYGDPAAVPFEIWNYLSPHVKNFNGYTHQWKTCDQRLKHFCMASVDSIKGYYNEYGEAKKRGWRTFRIRTADDDKIMEDEFICPASKEGGQKTVCEKCGACGGLSSTSRKNPVIILHGDGIADWRLKRYTALMKKIKNKKKWRRDYKAQKKEFNRVCWF